MCLSMWGSMGEARFSGPVCRRAAPPLEFRRTALVGLDAAPPCLEPPADRLRRGHATAPCDTHSRHKTTFSPSIFNWFAAIDPLFIAATQICVCCQTIGLLDTAQILPNFYQYGTQNTPQNFKSCVVNFKQNNLKNFQEIVDGSNFLIHY